MSPHFWILVFPDIDKPIGGVKQLHRLCEALIKIGYGATLVQDDPSFHPKWFDSSLPTISKDDWFALNTLSKFRDYVVLAETFIMGVELIKPGLPKIIFNQNSSYTFGLLDKSLMNVHKVYELYHHPDVVAIWCISDHDFGFIRSCISASNTTLAKLINPVGIDYMLPVVDSQKRRQISYMPRKNPRHSDVVVSLCKRKYIDWNFVPIEGCSHEDVIKILIDSICFLSFGYPEGFGLPVAEAMICGCYVIGYSGLGGRELFTYSSTKSTSVEVEFGDLPHFVRAIDNFIDICNQQLDLTLINLSKSSQEIRLAYSNEEFYCSLRNAVNSFLNPK